MSTKISLNAFQSYGETSKLLEKTQQKVLDLEVGLNRLSILPLTF